MVGFDPVTSISNTIGTIIDKIWPDKDEAEKAKVRYAELAQAGEFKELDLLLEQIKVNAIEAASEKWWVAGWRPFIGWVCGFALAWQYILMPLGTWIFACFGQLISMPALEASELMTILLGMLGLGAYRSYDKKQNSKK